MISSLSILNFKCFRAQTIHLGKLNVFCGANGVGKSSVIQSLLIAREAVQCPATPKYVKLNNLFNQNLGQVLDVLHLEQIGDCIMFVLTDEASEFKLKATINDKQLENSYLRFNEIGEEAAECFRSNETGFFTYLQAERDGPRDVQQIQSIPEDHLQMGPSGEYIAEVLAMKERDDVRSDLLFPDETCRVPNKLLPQLERWANVIFPGIELKTIRMPESNAVGIRIKKPGLKSDWQKPANVGFGISYCLPILLGGLTARENGLFIVDSPEAHLHPASQSSIAQFLCHIANANTQVFVETHSDHILNGVRLAVAKGELPADAVRIHHLDHDERLQYRSISVSKEGSLSCWPSGFFDQIEKDLAEIVRRKRDTRQ